jgi:conserved domain protein
MVTRRRAVVTAILCSMFAFGVSAAYAESSKGNAGDKALASRYEAAKNELSATKAENDELKRKLEAADGAKANAESEAGKLQSQINALTSERNTCKSDLAAKNGSSAVQPTQSQANGVPTGGSNAPSGTSSGRASSGQSGQSGQAGNGDSGYSAPAAPSQEGSVYYHNCAEARAKGVTPIYRGQPGYRPKLDRDGDGIACERR